jgi:hypothetical protein
VATFSLSLALSLPLSLSLSLSLSRSRLSYGVEDDEIFSLIQTIASLKLRAFTEALKWDFVGLLRAYWVVQIARTKFFFRN